MSAIDSTSDDVDINVEDEGATEPAPSVIPKATASEPSIDSSRKPRPRMTLRIPDDEVVRPSQIPPEPRATPSRAEIAPSRIITINPPPSTDSVVTSAKPLGLVGMPTPAVVVPSAAKSAPRALDSMGALDDSTALDVMPVTSSDPPPEPLQSSDAVELDEAESAAVLAAHRSQMLTPRDPPEAEPVAARPPSHTVPDVPDEAAPESPRAEPSQQASDTMQIAAQTDGEGDVDIPVDEDEPAPPSDAEIAPEDLVSVESMPRDEP
ncbi:MAG: hypothetical protein JWM74_1279, partial [Myxococcaceae bacterium]|nr:hypothetical protein [Myxococcaceae bacterium]